MQDPLGKTRIQFSQNILQHSRIFCIGLFLCNTFKLGFREVKKKKGEFPKTSRAFVTHNNNPSQKINRAMQRLHSALYAERDI